MAVRFDLTSFAEGLAQAASGMLAGEIAGEQERRRREVGDFNRQVNLAGLLGQQQHQQNQTLLGQFPRMTDQSVAQALGNIGAQPNPYEGLLQNPYIQRNPDMARILQDFTRMQGAMRGTPPTIPTPGQAPGQAPQQPTFRYGGGTYALKGFDTNEAKRVMGALDKSLGEMRGIKLTDPRHLEARDEYFRQRATLGVIDSPEKLQQASALYQNLLNFQSAVGGPIVQAREASDLRTDVSDYEQEFEKGNQGLNDLAFAGTLPGWLAREESLRTRYGARGYGGKGLRTEQATIRDIEMALASGDEETAARLGREVRGRLGSRVTAQQEQRGVSEIAKIISGWAPQQVTPANVRALYQTYDGGRFNYLVEGVPDELLRVGGSAMEKNWQKGFDLLTNPNRWKNAPPEVRKAALAEIQGIAAATGRKIKLPADYVLEMDPETRRRLAQRDSQLDLQGRMLDQRKAELQLQRDKFDWKVTHPEQAGAGKSSEFTKNAKAVAARGIWEKAWADYNTLSKGLKTTTADFDPLNPDMKDSDQVALSRAYKAALKAGAQYKTVLKGLGLDIDVNVGTGGVADGGTSSGSVKDQNAEAIRKMQEEAARAKTGAPPGAPAGVRPPATGKPGAAAPAQGQGQVVIRNQKTGASATRRQIYDDLKKRGYSDAEINAVLRKNGLL